MVRPDVRGIVHGGSVHSAQVGLSQHPPSDISIICQDCYARARLSATEEGDLGKVTYVKPLSDV